MKFFYILLLFPSLLVASERNFAQLNSKKNPSSYQCFSSLFICNDCTAKSEISKSKEVLLALIITKGRAATLFHAVTKPTDGLKLNFEPDGVIAETYSGRSEIDGGFQDLSIDLFRDSPWANDSTWKNGKHIFGWYTLIDTVNGNEMAEFICKLSK